MREKIHRENEKNRGRHAGENSATREADAKWRSDENDDQATPGQGITVLQMRRERREQDGREVGVEMQVIAQFRNAERVRVQVRAGQSIRSFAPIFDDERGIVARILDVSRRIVVHHFHFLQFPGFIFRMINGAVGEIIARDVVLLVLLQDLDALEVIFSGSKRLNEPGAIVRPVAKDLADHSFIFPARVRFFIESALREIRMRCERVIQRRHPERCDYSDEDQRQNDTRHANPRRQHRYDFVRTRHATEAKKQPEQKRDWQEDNENLRDLRKVIMQHAMERQTFVEKRGDLVANVEDEPDGEERGNAIKVGLQKIAQHVAVEQFHVIFRMLIWDLR